MIIEHKLLTHLKILLILLTAGDKFPRLNSAATVAKVISQLIR